MYDLLTIASSIHAQAFVSENFVITDLYIDSRKVNNPTGGLFFALEGRQQNGHSFISELYASGFKNFVVENAFDISVFPEANFLKVHNTLQALQQLAAFHRSHFSIPVIGITGSNGKTIVKEWLFQLLQADYHLVRSPKSYNSQLGVPLSVWQMNASHTLAIFEAGISQNGEMDKLQEIIQPTIGILTNIGEAHSEGFANKEEKFEEKWKLFAQADNVIWDNNDSWLHAHIESKPAAERNIRACFLQIVSKEVSIDHTLIEFLFSAPSIVEEKRTLQIPFTDDASIQNALLCYQTLAYLGYSHATIQERILQLHPLNMRLELKEGLHDCLLINDSYSADISSLEIALHFLAQKAGARSTTVILSDFLEAQQSQEELYGKIADLLISNGIKQVVGIGKTIKQYLPQKLSQKAYSLQQTFFANTADFLSHSNHPTFFGEAILIKGARSFKFEKIVAHLQKLQHETVLEINLSAIAHNLRVYRQMLAPNTKIMAMVKAFAYGSGSVEIASVLQFSKVDYLGVAYTDEGVALRKAGIHLPIMVLNPEELAFDALTEYQLEPTLFSTEIFYRFKSHVEATGLSNYPIHLEVETGMHRLGISDGEVSTLCKVIVETSSFALRSVFSHLAASESKAADEFTNTQLERLQGARAIVERMLDYPVLFHIANSAGAQRSSALQLDMVRIGIGLYGVANDPLFQKQLQTVATLKSTIAQIKQLQPGDTVSYGRTGHISKPTTMAVVRLGYADGYRRALSNGSGFMMVNGQKAPVLGVVCMDMTMIDISQIPNLQIGASVEIFGPQLPISDLAAMAGTIPYEIMTAISPRVKRLYYEE